MFQLTATQKHCVSLQYPTGCWKTLCGGLRPGGMWSMICMSTLVLACITQESGPDSSSPSPSLKAAGAKSHTARNFSASVTRVHLRHLEDVSLVWLMAEARKCLWLSLPGQLGWPGFCYCCSWGKSSNMKRQGCCEEAFPHLGGRIQICPCGGETSQQGCALCLLGPGLVQLLSFPRRKRQFLQLGVSSPFRMWK